MDSAAQNPFQNSEPDGVYTLPGQTTILSAYETQHSNGELNSFKAVEKAGDLFSINEDIQGQLAMDPEKHVLTFKSGLDSKTRFTLDTKHLFSAIYTSKSVEPEGLSLSQALNLKLSLEDPKQDETCFTLLFYQLKGTKSQLVAYSFKTHSSKIALEWVQHFQTYLQPQVFNSDFTFKKRKFLFIINPFGGGRKASKLFEQYTKPMLELADVEFDIFETKRFQHGIELINKATDLNSYDALVAVGGDGMFHELVNGALTREDWSDIVKIPFGILPAGSANGITVSLGFKDFAMASVNIIRRNTTKFDVSAIYTSNKEDQIVYSLLDGVTGYLSDVDDTADDYRWMGPLRLDFAAIIRALFLKKYRTRIYYLPEGASLENCVTPIEPKQATVSVDQREPSFYGPRPNIPNALKGTNSVTDPIGDRLGTDWQTIDGAYSFVTVTNVPWISSEFRISNSATTSDGALSIITDSKSLTGFNFLSTLLKEVSNPGTGKFTSIMNEAKAHAVIIENLGLVTSDKPATSPSEGGLAHTQVVGDRLITWNPVKPGSFRTDGEVLRGATSVQIQVLPGLINLITPL